MFRIRVQGEFILCHILSILGRVNILLLDNDYVHKPPHLVSQVFFSRLGSTRPVKSAWV